MDESKKNIALLAGDGSLPYILGTRIRETGQLSLIIVLEGDPDRFNGLNAPVLALHPGRILEIFTALISNAINAVVSIGTLDKKAFLGRRDYDPAAGAMVSRMRDGSDTGIFEQILAEFEKHHISILAQDLFLTDLYIGKGVLGNHQPDERERLDATYGMDIARRLATLDIGQTIVVKNRVLLAVEAIEGTAETIKRGGTLSGGGAVVCKAARDYQDPRFDIPVVGTETIQRMAGHGCTCLAIEAGRILVVDHTRMIAEADRHGITIIGI